MVNKLKILKIIKRYTLIIGLFLILLSTWNAHYFKELFISGIFFIIYSLILFYIAYDIKKEEEKNKKWIVD